MTLKLGTTLYSLTNEFHGREYDFADLVREVARRDLGPGLEVVGFQSIRGFPTITSEFEREFRELIDETGLTPSCLGINADVCIARDRPMAVDEVVAYHERQIVAAATLGFPVVRYQFPAGAEAIRRLEPFAARHRVKLGLEIHAPATLETFHTAPFRDMYAEVQSEWLGFIPDFGSTARTVPPTVTRSFLDDGVPQGWIDLALEFWHGPGDAGAKMEAFERAAEAEGIPAGRIIQLSIIFVLFGRLAPEAWAEIIPQVVHIHGKCYDFEADGDEVAVDYARTLPVFLDGGYDGFMSTEYEGHVFSDEGGFAKIAAHHALCRRIIEAHCQPVMA